MDNPFGRIVVICLRNTPWSTLEELREAVDERNVNFVQSLYPGDLVRLEDLAGFGRNEERYDRSAFSLARNQAEVCRTSRCTSCPYNGHLYDVYPLEGKGKRRFYVDFSNRCQRWVRIQAAMAPKEEPQENPRIGFGNRGI